MSDVLVFRMEEEKKIRSSGRRDAGAYTWQTLRGCVQKAKQEAKNGNLLKSIEYFQKADSIHPSEKLKGRIAKLEEALQQLDIQNEQDDEFIDVLGSGLMLYKELYNKLFEHQKEGVAFMYRLHRDGRKGGILADDMGLGKTIQVIAFLSGMFDAELTNSVLLIMPTTLISNWVKEFEKWTPGMRVSEFHGTSKKERSRNLEKIQRKGGVLITTYQMLINNWQQLATCNGREFVWDYIILDEAHKIKSSSTKTAKSCSAIPAKNRILLTGTPIQNNLREMWALYDFACQGTLLGTAKTFKMEYENPIIRAREKDATPGEKALGLKISENLMKIIQPYFLRRTKSDVQHKKVFEQQATIERNRTVCTMPSLTRKNDFIIWVYLSSIQEDVYRKFISLDQIKELLMTTRSPLAELTILKKLCDHPRLLSARACVQLGLEGDGTEEHDIKVVTKFDHLSDEALINESGKLVLLIELLNRLKEEGHRTLVFSQSRKMLDMIDRILNNRGFKIMRIDGTVSLLDREKRISIFQTNSSYSVLLLTTQVGGVGLTLTSADRVVIFDPSWNPATDAQAVDRAYRIGQQANVVIYRLITCGTVEEKIYRRQIFKDSLIRQTTGDKKNPFRYFSKQELKELFSLEDTQTSSTQIQLQNMHSSQRKTDINLDEHIAYLHTLPIFGISDHDLLYSHEISSQEEENEYENEHDGQYIKERVQKAHELVQMESQLNEQLMENLKRDSEGVWLRPNIFPEKPKRRSISNDKPQAFPEIIDTTEHEIANVSCQMISLVIEDSDDETLPSVSFKKEQPNSHISSLAIEDDSLPPAPLNCETSKNGNSHSTSLVIEPFDENLTHVPYRNELPKETVDQTNHLITEECSEDDISDPVTFTKASSNIAFGSSLINGYSGMEKMVSAALPVNSLGIKSSNSLPSCVIKAAEREQPCIKENVSLNEDTRSPLSNSQFQCDFNLVLEDSMDDHSASVHEMETSIVPAKEVLLILDDSLENMSQKDNCFECSMELERKSRNISVNEEDSKYKLEGCAEVAETFQNEMDILNSCLENSTGEVSRIDAEESDEEEILFATNRKGTRRICSESETESSVFLNEENEREFSPFNSPSAKVMSVSTPKLEKCWSDNLFPQRSSLGRRKSIASRRSLVHVAVEEATDIREDINDGDDEVSDQGEEEELLANEVQEGDDEEHEHTEEKPMGEIFVLEDSLLTSEEDYEHDSFAIKFSSNEEIRESTGEVELLSDEQVDYLAAEMYQSKGSSQEDDYSILVKRGKELKDGGHVKEALHCFEKALNIKSGDPELMMITLSLYRQLC
ncbi:DNA excision repair protein ERCC-6-like isoform X1 [Bufo gargarizans]|uniref:DNA excision repair protein ERCC-6-like isoform X1 n=2 Tax=Bufo gargarizans TaxID=30331 RepID=UPI001CF116CB|nr:DNA excision repair protein ERCC-6-like isoform X1 [Bufo gargarizans]